MDCINGAHKFRQLLLMFGVKKLDSHEVKQLFLPLAVGLTTAAPGNHLPFSCCKSAGGGQTVVDSHCNLVQACASLQNILFRISTATHGGRYDKSGMKIPHASCNLIS